MNNLETGFRCQKPWLLAPLVDSIQFCGFFFRPSYAEDYVFIKSVGQLVCIFQQIINEQGPYIKGHVFMVVSLRDKYALIDVTPFDEEDI